MKKYNWPGSVGICVQCFNPINKDDLYQHRQQGRKFHRECFNQGGYYVEVERGLNDERNQGCQ